MAMLWRLLALLGVALLAMPCVARPFTVEDMLKLESFGAVVIAPDEHWLVFEQRRPYADASRFDYQTEIDLALDRLFVVDLSHPSPAEPLLSEEPGSGYSLLSFSPKGTKLAIARLSGRSWELGIVTMATRHVQWIGLAPALADEHRALQWHDDDHLIILCVGPADLPEALRADWQAMARLPAWWETAARGALPTATAIGSGAYLGIHPKPSGQRLMLIDTRNGAVRALASGDIADFELSPDQRHIALLRRAGDVQPTASSIVGVGTQTNRGTLSIVDLVSGSESSPCPDRDIADGLLTWSATRPALLIFGRRDHGTWDDAAFLRVATSGRSCEAIAPQLRPVVIGPPDFAASARSGWLEGDPIIYAHAPGAARADWYRITADGPVALTKALNAVPDRVTASHGHDMTLVIGGRAWTSGGTGQLSALPVDHALPDPDRIPGDGERSARSASASMPLVVGTSDRGDLEVHPLDQRSRSFTVHTKPGSQLRAIAPHRHLAVTEDRDDHGVTTMSLAGATGSTIALATIDRHLAAVTPATAVAVASRAPDGALLTHWLYLPDRIHSGEKPPLIVLPYPDDVYGDTPPADQGPTEERAYTNAELLAGHGYAVLVPSMLPAPGGEPAAGMARRILDAVDAVVKRGLADPDRIGLWGHSFGGYAAVVAATQTDRFRAVVASAGLYDLASMRGTFLPARRVAPEDGLSINVMTGWTELGQARLGTTPWSDPLRYVRNSPLFGADRIHTPLLLIQGDQDIASLPQAEEMFSSLYRQAKDAVLVTYWGEGHVIMGPANIRDMFDRVFAWFDGHLSTAAPVTDQKLQFSPTALPIAGPTTR